MDILVDFKKHVETRYGKQIDILYVGEETEFPRFLTTIQNTDNLLGVTNTSITEARKKIMKFTPPFMNNQVILLTNKNVPLIRNLNDMPVTFKGFTAQVITGSTHVEHMQKLKKEYYPG